MNLVSIFLCSFLPGTLLIDPLTAGGILGASSVLFGTRNYIYCQFRECCQEPYIRSNLPGLKEALEENVFGQHIVTETVIKSMKMHLRKDQPKKALAMSFHGWTGSGKNYVSNFIAESLYKEGLNSKFVHTLISTLHFPGQDIEAYKSNLQNWIKGNVTQCQRSLFIFDEIDKLPSGVIDAIIPFIDFHEVVDGVDYRKSIFIFLSNTGGKEITKFTYKHWENGMQRKDLSYSDLEESLNLGAFNELGGLQNADLIQKSLIDMYVPFLPLEKSHVKLWLIGLMDFFVF